MEGFQSSGIIRYDPPRPGMKRKTEWWAILQVDREITRYYRWWIKRTKWIDLCQPSWNAHVSIIRGERPKHHLMHLWKKYDGKRVTFTYSHNVLQSGGPDRPDNFWFVEVDSPELISIRQELELPCNWKLHMTVGRTW